MRILHCEVVLGVIFIKIKINDRKIRHYSQFYSLVTSKWVALIPREIKVYHSILYNTLDLFLVGFKVIAVSLSFRSVILIFLSVP